MLFKPKHIENIKNGKKIETRRRISIFKKGPKTGQEVPPLKIGSIQPIMTKLFGPTLGYIKILDRRRERLGDIDDISAKIEGGYTPEEYIKGLIEMYDGDITEDEILRVYTFKYIGVTKNGS